MKQHLVPFAGAILFVLSPSPARAQVNAEILRPDPYGAGWAATLDASLALARGNVDLFDLGGAARVQYQTLHPLPIGDDGRPDADALPWIEHRVYATVSGRFAETDGHTFASRAFAHARWTAMWHPNVGSDLFVQGQLDELQRLRARVVGGVGIRLEIVHERPFTLALGTAPMLEYDLISPQEGSGDAPETFDVRWTSYLVARAFLADSQLLLQATGYVQPRFDEFDDARVLAELEIIAHVTTAFAFGTTFTLLHDTRPPTGVQTTDLRLGATLRVSL